ncbi:MAG: chromate transporter [Verrucomicrobia bacterium]|nr:MAG: chromate transporter [Verrucomicrobiota bacterium]
MSTISTTNHISVRHPSFAQACRFWLKFGFISFGGPTAQIALLHGELVERKKWISESRFLHALNFCMLLPGPEAHQLAIYIGWLLHKIRGGVIAGTLFVLPAAIFLWSLTWAYAVYGKIAWVAAIFFGVKAAVMAIVAEAVIRIGSKALKNEVMWSLAVLAFVAIFFLKVPFPLVVLTAGLIGLVGGKFWKDKFLVFGQNKSGTKDQEIVLSDEMESPAHTKPSLPRAIKVSAIWLTLWWAPVLLTGLWRGWNDTVFREGLFFSKAAVVTLGGAYAVLQYVAQNAVEHFHWLQPGQMLDGLGLAETKPGPLIMVLQFVGFMGGWNVPGSSAPLLAATLGALISTWTTFTPCFLYVFLGGPYSERLRGNAHLTTALSAITAAVVGVVMNLAVWFGMHILLPKNEPFNWFAAVVGVLVFFGMWKWKWGIIPVIIGAGILGLLYNLMRGISLI